MMHRRQHNSVARSGNLQEPQLPPGYVTIKDILEHKFPVGKLVGVIGLVKDRRSPIPTGGSDWKSTLTLYDKSVEDEDTGLLVSIFRPQSQMPEPDAGDVVIASSIKIQNYRGDVSLITHRSTSLHIYSANRIPKLPKSAKQALEPALQSSKVPSDKEHEYVSWLYHAIDKTAVPDAAAFSSQVEQSRNVKEKFQLLKDVQEGQFCDIIGRVIKDPFDQMDKATLWISDYTQNDAFYLFSINPEDANRVQDGDPYGYTTVKNSASNNWPGPYGKRSIQVTCFGTQGEFVCNKVKAENWVRLRNLQIKYGRNSNNLEGFLREDRYSNSSGIQVDIYSIDELRDDPDSVDGRLKAAIKRRLEYEKIQKRQLKSLAADQAGKRKADNQGAGATNAKQRRKEKRAANLKEIEEKELEKARKKEADLGLNQLIKCENPDQPIFAIPSIVEPIQWTTTVNQKETILTLPFSCIKYRANVRVVDFRPSKLENFATWHKYTEYDMLSDYDTSSEPESDEEDTGTLDRYTGTKIWEWQFALLLEEADPKQKGKDDRVWVVVSNLPGQQLTDCTASDLRANPNDLNQLREQLFKLWGNLEEIKQAELQRGRDAQKRTMAQQPPPSSPPRPSTSHKAEQREAGHDKKTAALMNKPFTCCIQQYGVAVPEENPRRMDAGDGKRWERVFGLFGTQIGS